MKDHIKLLKKKREYMNSKIESYHIANNVELGDSSEIGKGVILGESVKIGKYSYVNRGTIISSGTIGNYCSIASNCLIGPDSHPINYISTSPFLYEEKNILNIESDWDRFPNPPSIGNDVWIGANSVIMQGVNVGNGVIIGTGSIVTKDIPDYHIVAGVPSSIIRRRFDEKTIDYLLELRWWDMSEEELMNNKELFLSKEKWVDSINDRI
ncbi:CatB-related O-acetyltransferase [Metabacillus litoralis]|uniref:CatB-related O-acetyltransferase n=1 Tax=Metabacillus litoralis TaxID=152268 RepID=UPI00203C3913|nr:CatB-related O-acetyltransferase [Metabacillus litoralis]